MRFKYEMEIKKGMAYIDQNNVKFMNNFLSEEEIVAIILDSFWKQYGGYIDLDFEDEY